MTLETLKIHKKLFEIQQQIGAIQKTETNPFFKSKYFDINALISQLQPLLREHGLLLLQPLICNEYEQNGVETQIIDVETGEMVTSFARLPELNDPQKTLGAITYFRRGSLQSLLGLQADDDDGNTASGKLTDPIAEDWQISKIDSLIHNSTIEEAEKTKIESELGSLTKKRANDCITYLTLNQKESITDEFKRKTQ